LVIEGRSIMTTESTERVEQGAEGTPAAAGKSAASAKEPARITDEAIAKLRSRIGIPQPHPVPPQYLSPNTDTFRIVARSYGDDNPLWSDPEYARASRWGEPIAPPSLVGADSVIGEDVLTEEDHARQHLLKGDPLRGVHGFYSATVREWWSPLRADRRIDRRNALVAVNEKPSDFGGRSVHEWVANVFADREGQLLSGQYRLMIRTEREKARERGKNLGVTVQTWSEEEIAEIDARYLAEAARGAEPRWFEDVEVGDPITPMIKGPLTVTDMIVWHTGMGMGLYGVAALRLAAQNRKRMPRFFHRDENGVPDVMQRLHWDPAFAQKAGNPTVHDYGRMRETWVLHACTDWMGDDAWLWKLRVEFRKFNYVSDLQTITGTVTRKYLHEDEAGVHPAVDLELTTVNQRGEVTAPGRASILLPSREYGQVVLPTPLGGAHTLDEALTASIAHFSTL
jgi:acyl dehydratase